MHYIYVSLFGKLSQASRPTASFSLPKMKRSLLKKDRTSLAPAANKGVYSPPDTS